MNTTNQIIGRVEEQARLQEELDQVRIGEGRIVLVAGEAGVGKTVLVEQVLSKNDLLVLRGRTAQDSALPYGPITAVLGDALRQEKEEEMKAGPMSRYLPILLPELGETDLRAERKTLTETIISAFIFLSKNEPVVIFLDDLQWADNATLELFPDLSDRIAAEKLLFVGIYRNDELQRGHRIRWVRNELRRRRMLFEITLRPLNLADSALLMKKELGENPSQGLIDLIYTKTQGLPLFVEELTDTLANQGRIRQGRSGIELEPGRDIPVPESIRDTVLLRLDVLSDEARKNLEVAAIAGMEFDFHLISQMTDNERGMDEIFEHHFIHEIEPGKGAFRHALTREAVKSEITWSRRRMLNQKIAEYLEKTGVSPELIVEHWLAANELLKARRALIASAERSCQLHAYRDAANAAHRGLEIWPEGQDEGERLEALEQFAHCAQVSGQLNDAVTALRELLESPSLTENYSGQGNAYRRLATVYGLQGAWEQAISARKAAAESFEKAKKYHDAAVEWLAAAARYTALLHIDSGLEMIEHARNLVSDTDNWGVQARALGLKGNLLAMEGKFQEGRETVQAGLSLALEKKLTEVASEVYRRLASVLEYSSDYSGAKEAYHTAYDFCVSQGEQFYARVCLGCMSYVLFQTGEWSSALDVCRRVIDDGDSPIGSRGAALGMLGIIKTFRGETRQARKYLQDALQIAKRNKIAAMELVVLWGLAVLEEMETDNDAAEQHYRMLMQRWEETQDRHDAIPALCWAATFFGNNHKQKEISMCAQALASIASTTGNPEALAGLAYTLGESSLSEGNSESASEQFQQALSHLEKLNIPLEKAQAEYRAGKAFLLTKENEKAVHHLQNGYRLARNLGARPLAAIIAEELNLLGKSAEEKRSPDAEERIQRGGLTSRQAEIICLIADGLTNKEIADRLFLSPRTVEMHVANLLNRLDCRSRSEAVRKASELGLLD